MNSIKKKIEEKYSKIKNIFKEISNLISDAYKKIDKIEKLFDNHFKFNEIIFNSYKENKKNYYILKNFNNLNFNFEINFLKNDLTLKKLENLINCLNGVDNNIEINNINNNIGVESKTNEKIEIDNDYKNMWISEKYCKNWGLREAIREFIQNQYDGVITKIKSKKNLKILKVGKEYIIKERKKHLDYDFMKIGEDKIYGEIRYDKNKKTLSISNEGELFLTDFLLGGSSSKDELNNPDIIGVFGEGMKLAILALCRLEKNVTIFSSEKLYSFKIKEDYNFVKNNKPEKCLFCKIGKNYDLNMKNQVKVIIENINENEWGNEIDKFLWLLGKDIDIFTSLDKNNKENGQIIYENYLKNKIFVKGIYIQELEELNENNKYEKEHIPGFNANLKLDRDRNCIQNKTELKSIVSKIITGTFNKNTDYLRNCQLHTGNTFIRTEHGFEKSIGIGIGFPSKKSGLSKLTQILIDNLQNENEIIDYNELRNNLSKESIEIIWNEFDLKPENKNKQPTNYARGIDVFISEKKLPKDFYLYYEISYNLMRVLEKCSFYKSIDDKFKEYAENIPNEEPNKEYQIALNEVYSKIKKYIKENFNENQIKFKRFNNIDQDLCFQDKQEIYFSSAKLKEKLNKEWKFWIFIKILTILNVSIEKSYPLFFELFKKPIIQNSNILQIRIKDNILQIEE